MKTIAFFNHKGGVGKTTMLFNMAVEMGRLGQRTLMVDPDAQANLTAISVPDVQFGELYKSGKTTVADAFAPLVSGAGDMDVVEPIEIRKDAVFLLPGDIRTSEFEGILPGAWTESLATNERGLRVTSAPYRLIEEAGEIAGADYAFVDLGPNVGALNRATLLGADYLILPMAADLFSLRALPSVGKSVAEWVRQWAVALSLISDAPPFDLPIGKPKVLGYVSQQFNIYRGGPTQAFQSWIDKMPAAVEGGLLAPLRAHSGGDGTTLADPADAEGAEIGTLKNYHSLVPQAQELRKAIFELDAGEALGAQLTRALESEDDFRALCETVIDRVS